MSMESRTAQPRRVDRVELLGSLVGSLIVVGLMWVLACLRGAVGISRADDWSYLLTQFEFGRTGEFVLNNWGVTMLIGQTLAAWPVTRLAGDSIAWHQAFVAVFGVVGLWLAYLLVRRYLSRSWSVLSIATLAIGPLFAPSAISFMTDVPAFAFMSAALLAGAVALDRTPVSWPLLAASLLLSLIAFTFRDYAILAGVAIVLIALVRPWPSRAALMAVVTMEAVLVAVAGALYLWRHSLPNDLKLPGWDLEYSITLLGRASLTAALLISPALAFVSVRAIVQTLVRLPAVAISGVVVWLGLVVVSGLQFLGNVVHPFGTSWLVGGPGIRMWPLWVNRVLILVSAVFLLLLLGLITALLVRWWRSGAKFSDRVKALHGWLNESPGLSVFVVSAAILFAAHTGATLLLGTWWIDRYFILWIPFACAGVIALSLRFGWNTASRSDGGVVRSPARVVGFVWTAIFFVMSFHVVDFDALIDGTKWRAAAEVASAQGVELERVDGGMPFVAFHEPFVGIGAQDVPTQAGRPWWIERYPGREFCWSVAFAPRVEGVLPGGESVTEFRSFLGADGFVYVLPGPDNCDSPA